MVPAGAGVPAAIPALVPVAISAAVPVVVPAVAVVLVPAVTIVVVPVVVLPMVVVATVALTSCIMDRLIGNAPWAFGGATGDRAALGSGKRILTTRSWFNENCLISEPFQYSSPMKPNTIQLPRL